MKLTVFRNFARCLNSDGIHANRFAGWWVVGRLVLVDGKVDGPSPALDGRAERAASAIDFGRVDDPAVGAPNFASGPLRAWTDKALRFPEAVFFLLNWLWTETMSTASESSSSSYASLSLSSSPSSTFSCAWTTGNSEFAADFVSLVSRREVLTLEMNCRLVSSFSAKQLAADGAVSKIILKQNCEKNYLRRHSFKIIHAVYFA